MVYVSFCNLTFLKRVQRRDRDGFATGHYTHVHYVYKDQFLLTIIEHKI